MLGALTLCLGINVWQDPDAALVHQVLPPKMGIGIIAAAQQSAGRATHFEAVMAEYDVHNPDSLSIEEEDLFLEFFRLAAKEHWSSPLSWPEWDYFWRLGLMLWRTKSERLSSLKFSIDGTRWSGIQNDSDWMLNFRYWLRRGYDLARCYEETRDSHLICHAAYRAIKDGLGEGAHEDLLLLKELRPSTLALKRKIRILASQLGS
ncbi:MAG: hypothetical protein HY985_00350 [Magnetospirillum sp.]|nr:hypothetical protein [Magnetospirillum sp.]